MNVERCTVDLYDARHRLIMVTFPHSCSNLLEKCKKDIRYIVAVTSKGASASYSWHSYNFCDLWDVVCHQCVPFLPLLGHGDTLPEWGEVPAVCLSARQYLCERERKALLTIWTLVFLWDHSAPQPWYWVCLGTVWLYHGGICAMVKKKKTGLDEQYTLLTSHCMLSTQTNRGRMLRRLGGHHILATNLVGRITYTCFSTHKGRSQSLERLCMKKNRMSFT